MQDPPDSELLFLGTSSMMPSATRNVSCTCLRVGSRWWVFDCGEGTQIQLLKAGGRIAPGKITRIFLTHLHGDHCFGLPGLMCKIGTTNDFESNRLVQIIGPAGTRKFVRQTLHSTSTGLIYQYVVHELHKTRRNSTPHTSDDITPESESVKDRTTSAATSPNSREDRTRRHPAEREGMNFYNDENGCWNIKIQSETESEECFTVTAGELKHTIQCFGYVLTEKNYTGKMQMTAELRNRIKSKENNEFCMSKGIKNPMTLLGVLKSGKSIELVDGVVSPNDVLGPERLGRKITILGDTCDSSRIAQQAFGSTYLVHEATNAYIPSMDKDSETHESVLAKAYTHGHSTPLSAAQFAKDIQCDTLLLNHFSSRYKADDEETMKIIQLQAESVFDKTVICAHDFLSVPLLLPSKRPDHSTPPGKRLRQEAELSSNEIAWSVSKTLKTKSSDLNDD